MPILQISTTYKINQVIIPLRKEKCNVKNSGLTEKQIQMLKKKFDKGYTLTQFAEDLELAEYNIGDWEEGALTELIEEGDYLEYLASKEDIHIYRPYNEYVEEFLNRIDYEIDGWEHIDWNDRKEIYSNLQELKGEFRLRILMEELDSLGIIDDYISGNL